MLNILMQCKRIGRKYKFIENPDYKNENINNGDLVKVVRNGESFWVKIEHIFANGVLVRVDNNVFNQPFGYGDRLVVNKRFLFHVPVPEYVSGEKKA